MRSDAPADLVEAWRQLSVAWVDTVERVRAMPQESEHRRVDGEWSMVETLRHLVFVHDSWFHRCVLGLTEPFTAIGLGPSSIQAAEGLLAEGVGEPTLDEVLKVQSRQNREVEKWLAATTPEQLSLPAPVPDDERWPTYAPGRSVRQCLGTVLNEEWEHHRFVTRDLDKLTISNSD
jgi:uncharacterized damage-inducible protein DinB